MRLSQAAEEAITEDVKTRDKVRKVGEDVFKIKSTKKASLNIL